MCVCKKYEIVGKALFVFTFILVIMLHIIVRMQTVNSPKQKEELYLEMSDPIPSPFSKFEGY